MSDGHKPDRLFPVTITVTGYLWTRDIRLINKTREVKDLDQRPRFCIHRPFLGFHIYAALGMHAFYAFYALGAFISVYSAAERPP